MARMDIKEIVNEDSKFDPTTPFGTWDNVAKEFENTTDKVIFNLDKATVTWAQHHNVWSSAPTPISGDMLTRYKHPEAFSSTAAA